MPRVSQCFRHSGRFSDVFVCGLTSAPRWLWDGSGTHYLGCGDVFCLRSDALCSFMFCFAYALLLLFSYIVLPEVFVVADATLSDSA